MRKSWSFIGVGVSVLLALSLLAWGSDLEKPTPTTLAALDARLGESLKRGERPTSSRLWARRGRSRSGVPP